MGAEYWVFFFFFFSPFFIPLHFGFPFNCDSLSLHCLPLLGSPHVLAYGAYKVALTPDIVGKAPANWNQGLRLSSLSSLL